MEFAQALILTNALGGLSSLGRASAEPEWTKCESVVTRLDRYDIELHPSNDLVQLYLFDKGLSRLGSNGVTSSRRIVSTGLDLLLPGRLIIQTRQRYQALPLYSADDHLAAHLDPRWAPCRVAIELTINGSIRRSQFVPAQLIQAEEF